MMQRCSNMVGPCTCGLYHSHSHSHHNSFSMLFNPDPPPTSHHYYYNNNNSSSVDCTLSLATPSSRLSDDHHRSTTFFRHPNKTSSRASNNNNDPLLARRCSNCDTTSTPLWRNGPRGPKSLCNACGIRFKKEERRAASAAAASGGGGAMAEQQHVSWSQQTQKMAACYSPAGNEFRFGDEVDARDSFLSWRLNVTDRPALVHDFTR